MVFVDTETGNVLHSVPAMLAADDTVLPITCMAWTVASRQNTQQVILFYTTFIYVHFELLKFSSRK